MPLQPIPFTVVQIDPGENDEYVVRLATAEGLAEFGIDHVSEIKLDLYPSNPVVLWRHNDFEIPIGRSTTVFYEEESQSIIATFTFLPGDEFSQRVKNAWDQGYLQAASVGVDTEYYLREWSIVPVPHDPTALRLAHAKIMADLIPENSPPTTTTQAAGSTTTKPSEGNGGTKTSVDTPQTPEHDTSIPGSNAPNAGTGPDKEPEMTEPTQNTDLTPLLQLLTKQTEQLAVISEKLSGTENLGPSIVASLGEAEQKRVQAAADAKAKADAEEVRLNEMLDARIKALGLKPATDPPSEEKTEEQKLAEAVEAAKAKAKEDADKMVVRKARLIAMASGSVPEDFNMFEATEREILEAAIGKDGVSEDDTDDVLYGKLMVLAAARGRSEDERIRLMRAATGFESTPGGGGGDENDKKAAADKAHAAYVTHLEAAWESPGSNITIKKEA